MPYETLWLKKVLIPFWVLQVLAGLVFLGFSAWGLAVVNELFENRDSYTSYYDSRIYNSSFKTAYYATAGAFIGIAALTIVFNIVEMILYGMKKLSPVTFVVFNTIDTLIWLIMMILLIVSAVRVRSTGLSWIFVIILVATSLGKLIYGSVILHRHRRGRFAHRGEYTPAAREHHEAGGVDTSYHHTQSYNGPTPDVAQTRPGGTAHEYYSPASVGARA